MEPIVGGIVEVVRNDGGHYVGNLASYFQALILHSTNRGLPYHNVRHSLHVTWLCHRAIVHYGIEAQELSLREARNLLVAAMFHDFDHSGSMGDDDLNIERAVRRFHRYIEDIDRPQIDRIDDLIRSTQYPHSPWDLNDRAALILRDADLSQAFSVAWIQEVVIGLAAEWRQSPLEVLRAQAAFHRGIVYETDWARALFPREVVEAKIAEAEAMYTLLTAPSSLNV